MASVEFDSVRLTRNGGVETLTRDEFLLIPLTHRVRYLLADAFEFFRSGEPVPPREALKSLSSS